MMRQINFPIFESIDIDGYLLYPGASHSPGLRHTFVPGVNVIVGINGIGKTTLLTLLLRMLTGPKDLRSGDELGGTQRTLVNTDTGILASRVPDRARDAKATLRFRLGDTVFEIVRSLANLEIVDLTVEGPASRAEHLPDPESRYQETIKLAASLDDFYDFVLLMRYLVFYLEDRRSLVWDKWAQTELLRILFVPNGFQREYKAAMNQALSADSTARNTLTILNKQKKALENAIRNAQKSTPSDLKILRIKVEELSSKLQELDEHLESLDETRRRRRRDAEQQRHEAELCSQQLRAEREQLLAQFFPTLSDYGALVLASIESGRGCLVCGTTDSKYLDQIANRIEHTRSCPLCGSEPALHEASGSVTTGDQRPRLDELDELRKASERAAKLAEQEAQEVQGRFIQVQLDKDKIDVELAGSRQELEAREFASQESQPEELAKLDKRIVILQETVDEALRDKEAALSTLTEIVSQLTKDVGDFRNNLIDEFADYVKRFLAERCVLDFRSVPRRIGQGSGGPRMDFPEFHVQMTSSVFRQSGTAREEYSEVSESQKEFVELAFRMALLTTACGDNRSTLIVETPEANLDAVFIPKAGATFNEFAARVSPEHVIVATSNLNGGLMIPSLLGLVDEQGKQVPTHKTSMTPRQRVLDLLAEAASSRALQDYSEEYRKWLSDALMEAS